ncbi:MAG: bifunctional nicotinamidase/pyrazinamidase [Ignavibacteria bacterium]|jgi:nicotinamidase/pyrazinamidase|nr:bifunctional nicotinamidase/pyrazinamidase [Ignavibacteria bacterium]MCU7502869.1 bifunctional nicotinamidase/pyrazinamidase [Ignavibacteria bacterium]MCU7515637.1 bifunctional nicotinamidase/pyrazinamidase [Ignavibacteria bacterium]
MNVFLIVDIQNDFLPGGALAVGNGDRIIPLINRLQHKFDLVVATQDWHPRDHKSFASNHPGKIPFDEIMLEGLKQVLWPDHCVQGSPGADFSGLLDMNKVEAIFRKGMDPEIDSYSAFYDNGHKKSTGLADFLRGRKTDKIFMAGLAKDFCVYYSVKDALHEGFNIAVIEDASMPINEKESVEKMNEIKRLGAEIIHSSSF